jgi:protein-tyrosine phosphatase
MLVNRWVVEVVEGDKGIVDEVGRVMRRGRPRTPVVGCQEKLKEWKKMLRRFGYENEHEMD